MESIDKEIYTATENSDIPIIKDDGTIDSLQNIIDENLQREEAASLDADDFYTATPISEISIVQEDGSVDTLENIMSMNEQNDVYRATPISEIPIVQEDGSIDTLKNIMDKNMEEHIKEPDCVPELSVYSVSPYALVWNDDCYYALGYSDIHEKVVKFRVDRMVDMKISEKAAVRKPKDFEVSDYFSQIFSMYDGEECRVTLLCENDLMKSIIDRFGESVFTAPSDAKHFVVETTVSLSQTFYGWVFSFGGKMKITSPQQAIDGFEAILKKFK